MVPSSPFDRRIRLVSMTAKALSKVIQSQSATVGISTVLGIRGLLREMPDESETSLNVFLKAVWFLTSGMLMPMKLYRSIDGQIAVECPTFQRR